MTLGQRIRQLRAQRSWTQAELAQRCLCAANTVARWERDEMVPDWWSACALGGALGVSAVELLKLVRR